MKQIIVNLLLKETKLSNSEIESLLEVPPTINLGDYAFPCFTLAKKFKKNPIDIAKDLQEKIGEKLPKEISRIKVAGAYLNFFVDKKMLAEKILLDSKKKDFGKSLLGKNKKKLIEFSQPNTHKAFHVGHIRGTALGESIARIAEFAGEKVIRANYSGDTGMHIAKWIWCYQTYHQGEPLQENEEWIANIYVEAVKKLEENDSGKEEVEKINKKIEDKSDPKINELWKKTRKASINSWEKIYEELDTHFDKHYFESEFEVSGKKAASNLLKEKIAKKDDAVFMDLKEYNLGTWVLLRKDGTVLYSAKDVALAIQKTKDFSCDTYLITIGEEQKMHFEQLLKTLELMKFKKTKNYSFQTFGMVRFPEGKMSSRTGKNILYSEFSSQVKELAKKSILFRSPETKKDELEEKSQVIALAAIKYSMLKQDSRKTMIFDPKEALSFEGDTGPYLLYSYARANSILRKVFEKRKSLPESIIPDELRFSEIKLLKKIAQFPGITSHAYESLSPHVLANYSFELAKLFNEFYHDAAVLGSKEEGFRLQIVMRFKETLLKSLNLLGIKSLESM